MNKVNDILEHLFHIRLIRSAPLPKKQSIHKNIVVEFFGTSGVGKSTLCNYFIKKTTAKKKILQTADLVPYIRDKRVKLSGIYDDLLSAKIDEVTTNSLPGFQKYSLINFYHRIISISSFINEYLNNNIIFLEEGVFHNFSQQILTLVENKEIEYIFRGTVLIYCTASPEFIVKNINKRMEDGTTMIHHQGLNGEQLYEFVKKNIAERTIYANKLRAKGVPLLEISTENDRDYNCKMIENYLENLLK